MDRQDTQPKSDSDEVQQLTGSFLVAMPGIDDPRFERTVIYICAHNAEGAMGLVLNRPARDVTFSDLMDQLDLSHDDYAYPVNEGGPVETGRGFVLHSADFILAEASMQVSEGIYLTGTIEILEALGQGTGPEEAFIALGYAGWDAGQLEAEIQMNGWLFCNAENAIIFGENAETKWERALLKIGITPGSLSSLGGRA